MTDVVFYDFDFNRLGDYPRFISLNIEKKYCGYGTAEIHYPVSNSEILNVLKENPYLFFQAGDNSVIVTGWRVGEDIAIFGRTPEWLLTKRGATPFSKSGKTPGVIAGEVTEKAAGDFVVLGSIDNTAESISYSTEDVKTVYDIVCSVLKPYNLGFRVAVKVPEKKFVFDVIKGEERLCILSQSNRTAYNMEYTLDRQKSVDGCGWYKRRYVDKGSWDAINNVPLLYDKNPANAYTFYHITSQSYKTSGNPMVRFEIFCENDSYLYCDNKTGKWKISKTKPDTVWIYMGSSNQTGAKRWEAVLDGVKTEEEATAALATLADCESSETETKNTEYGTDYCLGDILKVQTEIGDFKKTEKKRVTAVNIYFDADKSGVIPILETTEV